MQGDGRAPAEGPGRIACVLVPFFPSPFAPPAGKEAQKRASRRLFAPSLGREDCAWQPRRLRIAAFPPDEAPQGGGRSFVFSLGTSCPHSRHRPHRAGPQLLSLPVTRSSNIRSAACKARERRTRPGRPDRPGAGGVRGKEHRAVHAQRRPTDPERGWGSGKPRGRRGFEDKTSARQRSPPGKGTNTS